MNRLVSSPTGRGLIFLRSSARILRVHPSPAASPPALPARPHTPPPTLRASSLRAGPTAPTVRGFPDSGPVLPVPSPRLPPSSIPASVRARERGATRSRAERRAAAIMPRSRAGSCFGRPSGRHVRGGDFRQTHLSRTSLGTARPQDAGVPPASARGGLVVLMRRTSPSVSERSVSAASAASAASDRRFRLMSERGVTRTARRSAPRCSSGPGRRAGWPGPRRRCGS